MNVRRDRQTDINALNRDTQRERQIGRRWRDKEIEIEEQRNREIEKIGR